MSYVIIEQNKCKACYLCVEVCPKKLIKKGSEANALGHYPVVFEDNNNECIGCAMCAQRCPDMAIVKVVKN